MNQFTLKIFSNKMDPSVVSAMMEYADKYFQSRLVDITISVNDVSVTEYESQYSQVRPGYWEWILESSSNLVSIDSSYDINMFIFDQNEWKTAPGSPFPLSINTPSSDTIILNGKPFINLGVYSPLLNNAEIMFCHEIMHALRMIAQARGFVIDDCMDVMYVNGLPQLYYLNNDPTNVNSNFTNMWEQFFATGFLKETI